MVSDETKRTLRKLKRMEGKIRFGSYNDFQSDRALVWDEFFCLNGKRKNVRYPAEKLAVIDKVDLKDIISEFYYNVYYRFYRENGILNASIYDPDALSWMDLPRDADSVMIKRRFRELAKKYHPDTGGDDKSFRTLMEVYDNLF